MPVTAVVGCQWGDEGKGKVVDLLGESANVVARFQGGPNAGHTVVYEGKQIILHQIPSGILRENVACCLGNGCVLDPVVLFEEISDLEKNGTEIGDRLMISNKAHLIMPYHRAIDEAAESAAGKGKKIGTTGRGIGPAYTDKYNRCGIRLLDLKNPTFLENRLRENIEDKNKLLKGYFGSTELDANHIVDEYLKFHEKMSPFITDVSVFLQKAIDKKQVVILEGAQGTLLDIDHGTYPFVTSSNPSAGAAATGLGIGPRKIDRVLGILKAYTTRVGNGPFPTELTGELQTQFREWGGEFGATTGRARRCGWLDLVIANYSVRINGLDAWAITKLDVLSNVDEIKVCTKYEYRGKTIEDFPPEPWILKDVDPVYETFPGWKTDISDARTYNSLPVKCRRYLDYIIDKTKTPIDMVSVGADRNATIRLR